ncbi:MAG: hypothetical protein JXR25_05865, partial [Pontiellaceae bacterium]|nr:hypothetical protein [Pontiellaceae bacterium]
GHTVKLTDRTFKLQIHRPVEFPLYTSSIRTQDRPGDLLAIDAETMRPMPSIKTVIGTKNKKAAGAIEVQLHARLTEIGTIEVWCSEAAGTREWRLQFDARAATQTDRTVAEDEANRQGLVDESVVRRSVAHLENVLGPNHKGDPSSLLKELEQICESDRGEWPPALLRRWFESLIPWSACRDASSALEARWLNLTGYTLRPGYGFAVDDWRVAQAWKLKQNGVINHRNEMCRAEWWILWRRLAGGLTENQQMELANPLIRQWNTRINNPNAKPKKQNDFQFGDHECAEVWRMLGSLERLPLAVRKTLGELLIHWIERKGHRISNGAAVWALGRIGARVPTYGPLDTIVEAEAVEGWIERLLALSEPSHETAFALMHMARRTDDRYRDISEPIRIRILEWMRSIDASPRLIELVRDGGLLDAEEQDHTFGEALPPGLHLQ